MSELGVGPYGRSSANWSITVSPSNDLRHDQHLWIGTRSRAQRTFLVEANETIPSSHLDHEVVARHRPEAGSSGVQPERARRRHDGMDAGREFHAASLVVMTMHPLEATLVVIVPAEREFFRRLTGHLLAMVAAVAAASVAAACVPPARVGPLGRHPVLEALGVPPLNQAVLTPVFKTGFERDADLTGFYVTPQSALTRHEVRPGAGRTGDRSHVGWLTGVTGVEPVDGPNHRGYPTIQLQRRPVGTCTTPCLIEFWARLDDVALKRGEWFSLGTFSADPSDRWARVITVNVGWEGWLHLFHVGTHMARSVCVHAMAPTVVTHAVGVKLWGRSGSSRRPPGADAGPVPGVTPGRRCSSARVWRSQQA